MIIMMVKAHLSTPFRGFLKKDQTPLSPNLEKTLNHSQLKAIKPNPEIICGGVRLELLESGWAG